MSDGESEIEQWAAFAESLLSGGAAAPSESQERLENFLWLCDQCGEHQGTHWTVDPSVMEAARNMDWNQVVLNGGPPCFRIEHGRFCGRAERWHYPVEATHEFLSLANLLGGVAAEREECAKFAEQYLDAAFCRGSFYGQQVAQAIRSRASQPAPANWVPHYPRLDEIIEEFQRLTRERKEQERQDAGLRSGEGIQVLAEDGSDNGAAGGRSDNDVRVPGMASEVNPEPHIMQIIEGMKVRGERFSGEAEVTNYSTYHSRALPSH